MDGEQQVLRIDNTVAAVRRWLKALRVPVRIGVESTGQLHRLLVKEAIASGHTVYLLNARDLAHYARALGRRAKTDRLDALLIARYLAHEHERLHPYQLPSKQQQMLDDLIRRRHKLIVAQGAVRASLSSADLKLRATHRMMAAFKAAVAEIDQRLKALVNADPNLATHASHLYTVVGFGPLLSIALAHALTRRPYRNDDAFIAALGLDPRVRDSGQLRGRRRLSKQGPAELRRLLFTAAMSACKSALWQPFYQRYRARGFTSTAALIIIARKLARIAFSIVKYGTTFQPERLKMACVQP
jgi:transposase